MIHMCHRYCNPENVMSCNEGRACPLRTKDGGVRHTTDFDELLPASEPEDNFTAAVLAVAVLVIAWAAAAQLWN